MTNKEIREKVESIFLEFEKTEDWKVVDQIMQIVEDNFISRSELEEKLEGMKKKDDEDAIVSTLVKVHNKAISDILQLIKEQ